ncbi:MAG: aminotransferase class I/II-fold pyridoxal phosphate-dependent enzyme [Spirochaetota bacterium]|nr:aminotransferase class I/II-fold pyridoxal phosphate-dependent enzyme [Spirochaetota bacterium]
MKLSLVKENNIEFQVSETASSIPPSGIREFFDLVYSTPDCISLGVGEPDFVTPWRISEAGIHAIKDGYTHYTPNRGLPELISLISDHLQKMLDVKYDSCSEIIVTNGVSQGLDLALRSILNPGDEVIIFDPCYVSYPANVSLLYGKPVIVPTYFNEKFRINLQRLEKAITPRTKAILLNYPANPTGATIDRDTLEMISTLACSNNLLIISDEVYSELTFEKEHDSIISIPGMRDRVIYLNGFSKSLAMTGWRLGYVAGPGSLIDVMLKIHQYTALCAPSISQYAAIEAMHNSEKDISRMRSEYLLRRNFIVNRFNELGLPCHSPDGAIYVFPDLSKTGMTSSDFALALFKSEKVAVVPGIAFGESGENHIRCSFATSLDNIKEAMRRIERFLKRKSPHVHTNRRI